MKLKIINEQLYQNKSIFAAQKYLNAIEFKRSSVNLPAVFVIIGVTISFAILLFLR